MSKDFPHINDTKFPDLDNVDVYGYKNQFDYTKWDVDTQIRLLNVNWNSDYSNVVDFGDDDKRDEYFDNLVSESVYLNSRQILQNRTNIKLPFTFDCAARFNYLQVIFPEQPVPEEASYGRRKMFFFIKSINSSAPSTTEFFLQLDVWTTFINSCEIPYCILQRGHAPMSESPIDKYLENPIKNNKYLLSEDYDVDNVEQVVYEDLKVLNDKDMYVCFTIQADVKGDWGVKKQVGWKIPSQPQYITNGIPNNLQAFAVKVEDYNLFMQQIYNNVPQFYKTIKCIFVLPKKLITLSDSFKFYDINCYMLDCNQVEVADFKLTKDKFNFGSKYENVTKLYTFPYSYIMMSDGNGNTKQIKIENTNNNIKALSNINVAFPFINMEVLFTGIGSESTSTTTFQNLDNRSFMYGGIWEEYLIKYDIPIYAVNPDVYNEYETGNYWNLQDMLASAEVTYNNSIDSINLENSNSIRLANANKVCSDRSAESIYYSADQSALATTDNTATGNALKIVQKDNNNEQVGMEAYLTSQLAQANQANNTTCTRATTILQEEKNRAVTGNNNLATAVSSVGGGAASGAMVGAAAGPVGMAVGAAIGGVVGIVGQAPGMVAAAANTSATNSCLTDTAEANISCSQGIVSDTSQNNYDKRDAHNNCVELNTTAEINAATTIASRNNLASRNVGKHNQDVGVSNATTTQEAQINNANDTKSVQSNNALRSYNLQKQKVEFAEDEGRLQNPMQYGQYKGLDSASYKPLCINYSLITKSDNAIAEIGDIFLRYGYELNQNWTFTKFNYMKHFTYWKVSEIWINLKNKMMNDQFRNDIKHILMTGTTIWANPDMIGKVSIYDNFTE